MSFVNNTAFQPRVWNNRNNDTQNIPGRFANSTRALDCSAGWLCNRGEMDESGVYKMTAAENGQKPVYICNPTDVRRLTAPNGNIYAVGQNTLSLGIPAGSVDTFTEAIVGEVYSFGLGNFTDVPTTTNKYCKIESGSLSPQSTVPSGEFYFVVEANIGEDYFTEGNFAAIQQYTVRFCKG